MSSKHGLTAIAESNTGAIHCSQEAPNLEDSCGSSGAHSQEDWYVCIPSTDLNKCYRCMPSSNELQQQELLQAQSYCREFLSCKKRKKNCLPSRKHNCQGKAQAGPTKSWCSQSWPAWHSCLPPSHLTMWGGLGCHTTSLNILRFWFAAWWAIRVRICIHQGQHLSISAH